MNFKSYLKYALFIFTLLIAIACSFINGAQDRIEELATSPTEESDSAPTAENAAVTEFQPSGVLINPGNGTSLKYYDAGGQLKTEIQTPGLSGTDPEDVHLAGQVSEDGSGISLLYHGWEPEQAIMLNQNSEVSSMRKVSGFLAMSGAAGQPAIAFSEIMIDDNLPHSYLYSGTLDDLGSVSYFYDLKDEYTQMALQPVAVKAIDGNSQGVWYTQTAWGIGGVDLIFPITRGLYYFDLTNGNNLLYLDPERNFQGISPNQEKAGSVEFDSDGDRSMSILDLSSGQSTGFSLKSNSDRGAGYAIFSPDSQQAAWLEAGGSFMTDPVSYHSVVRVGNLSNGTVEFEVEDGNAAQYIPGGSVSFMKPVGWLDNQNLLIEVRGEDWGNVYLLRFNLADQSLTLFCEGGFAGFGYTQ